MALRDFAVVIERCFLRRKRSGSPRKNFLPRFSLDTIQDATLRMVAMLTSRTLRQMLRCSTRRLEQIKAAYFPERLPPREISINGYLITPAPRINTKEKFAYIFVSLAAIL